MTSLDAGHKEMSASLISSRDFRTEYLVILQAGSADALSALIAVVRRPSTPFDILLPRCGYKDMKGKLTNFNVKL